nr:hypothetical protein [uncultured Marinifilum sp.]
MPNLCLTLDYELFGSGRGNVFQHIIEPTERLLTICSEHNVKLSIFFEVVEYWKIKEYYENGLSMGYQCNPADAMKEQIIRAYQQGHDVQLHVHPQWIDAKYTNDKWVLNLDYWRLPQLPMQANESISMGLNDLIRNGKRCLEEWLQAINPDYKCNIIRAGGYNVDPSQNLIKVLKDNDFVADSSVYYGGIMNSDLSKYDYSELSQEIPYWYSSRFSLLKEERNESGILELPVFADNIRRIHKYDWVRIRSALKNKTNAVEKFKNNSLKKSKWEMLGFILAKEAVTWDFCLFSTFKMKRYLKKVNKIQLKSPYPFHPFVLVGHPKDFYYSDALTYIIKYNRNQKGRFLTVSETIEKIKSAAVNQPAVCKEELIIDKINQ